MLVTWCDIQTNFRVHKTDYRVHQIDSNHKRHANTQIRHSNKPHRQHTTYTMPQTQIQTDTRFIDIRCQNAMESFFELCTLATTAATVLSRLCGARHAPLICTLCACASMLLSTDSANIATEGCVEVLLCSAKLEMAADASLLEFLGDKKAAIVSRFWCRATRRRRSSRRGRCRGIGR